MSIHALKRFFIVVCTLTTGDKHEAVFHAYWKDFLHILECIMKCFVYKLNGLMYLWWSLKWCRNFKTKKEEANEIVLDFWFLYPLYIYFCGLQSKYVNGLSDGNWEKEGASKWEREKGEFKNWFISFTQTFLLLSHSLYSLLIEYRMRTWINRLL